MILTLTIIFGCVLLLSIINVASGDIGEAPKELWEGCKEVAKTIYDTEDTELQIQVKEFIEKNSTRLMNIFFVIVIGLALLSGFATIYEKYGDAVFRFVQVNGFWNYAYMILILIISTLSAILIYIQVLLVLFKFFRVTDIVKVYIFIELAVLLIGYYKAEQSQREPIVVQMLNKVLDINLKEAENDSLKTSTFGVIKLKEKL